MGASTLLLGAHLIDPALRWPVGAGILGAGLWWTRSAPIIGVPRVEPEVQPTTEPVRKGWWSPSADALLDMVPLPAGEFRMGSDDYPDERPVHRVRLSPFAIARTPVTEAQWATVMGDETTDSQLPKTRITWFDAARFCNALSEREGRTPCYRIEGQAVAWQRDADGYRLPTEAEWEYACRAGTTTRWSHGDDEDELSEYAWFDDNADNKTHPVAQKKPNPWGLFDMHGNVWEWCWDAYGRYGEAEEVDPAWDHDVLLVVDRHHAEAGEKVLDHLRSAGLRVRRVYFAGTSPKTARYRNRVIVGDYAAPDQGVFSIEEPDADNLVGFLRQLDDKIVNKVPIRWARVLRGGAFWDSAWSLRSAGRSRLRPSNRNWDFGFRCVLSPRRSIP